MSEDIFLPKGIADAEKWRQRVRAALAAADTEGLTVAEVADCLDRSFGESFNLTRVAHWLQVDEEAGLAFRVDTGVGFLWRLVTDVPTDVGPIEQYLRERSENGEDRP